MNYAIFFLLLAIAARSKNGSDLAAISSGLALLCFAVAAVSGLLNLLGITL